MNSMLKPIVCTRGLDRLQPANTQLENFVYFSDNGTEAYKFYKD